MAKTFYLNTINLILTSYIEIYFLATGYITKTDGKMEKSKKYIYKWQHNIVTRQWKMCAKST